MQFNILLTKIESKERLEIDGIGYAIELNTT